MFKKKSKSLQIRPRREGEEDVDNFESDDGVPEESSTVRLIQQERSLKRK